MDSAIAPSTRIKTLHALPSLTTCRRNNIVNPKNLSTHPSLPSIRSPQTHYRSFSTTFPKSRKATTVCSPRCSTKPGIGSNNATNKNPSSLGLDPTSTTQYLTASPPDQTLTSTKSKGLVFDLGSKVSWDNADIGSPVVKRFIGDNEERWYMWYHGRSHENNTPDSIGLAVSSNGIHWARGAEDIGSSGEDEGLVMDRSENWWAFDTQSIRPSEMVIMSSPMYSSVYWLYYTGYSSEQVDAAHFGKMSKSLPGLACSQDGRSWARIEGDHHTGALLDVGSANDWDSLFIASPQVVMHRNDDLRMYYYSFDTKNACFAVGVARSRDGIRWVKLGKITGGGAKGSFDEHGVKNACVVRNRKEGNYLMAYEGVGTDGVRSIGMAVSTDGIKDWKRVMGGEVFGPSDEDQWDNKGVGSPCLVGMEGNIDEWRLYYVGVGKEGKSGIGMAVSEGGNVRSFRRWEGYHL